MVSQRSKMKKSPPSHRKGLLSTRSSRFNLGKNSRGSHIRRFSQASRGHCSACCLLGRVELDPPPFCRQKRARPTPTQSFGPESGWSLLKAEDRWRRKEHLEGADDGRDDVVHTVVPTVRCSVKREEKRREEEGIKKQKTCLTCLRYLERV